MKSIALSLVVLFGALTVAHAATEGQNATQPEGVVIQEVAAEEIVPADNNKAEEQE